MLGEYGVNDMRPHNGVGVGVCHCKGAVLWNMGLTLMLLVAKLANTK